MMLLTLTTARLRLVLPDASWAQPLARRTGERWADHFQYARIAPG